MVRRSVKVIDFDEADADVRADEAEPGAACP